MSAQPKHKMTVEEYLAFEETSDVKHEYYAGEIFALAGGNEQHIIISGNILASLHQQVRQRPCIVYNSDMKVRIDYTGLYTYPDISVVCGQALFAETSRSTLINPTVIIEVLSPSTEAYDRGKKFQNYRTIGTLQEYVLITQDFKQIEHYVRQPDDLWLLSFAGEEFDIVALPSIDCTLSIADVYEKVVFEAGEVEEPLRPLE